MTRWWIAADRHIFNVLECKMLAFQRYRTRYLNCLQECNEPFIRGRRERKNVTHLSVWNVIVVFYFIFCLLFIYFKFLFILFAMTRIFVCISIAVRFYFCSRNQWTTTCGMWKSKFSVFQSLTVYITFTV